jgi:predicted metal-dependent enzyme (double-stranded beta helix superfamily)
MQRGAQATAVRRVGRTLDPAQLGELVRTIAASPQSWRPIVRFTADRRWYYRLALAADYEVWLLSWLPRQSTGFHDHGDASGAFAVTQGELRESLAVAGRSRVRHRAAGPGSVTQFGGGHLHQVGNVSAGRAVSLHAYSPPLAAMRRYELTPAGLRLLRTDQAGLDW